MAVGNFTFFNQGKGRVASADLDAVTIVMILLDNAYTPNAAHSIYSDVSTNECADGDYAPQVLANVTVNHAASPVNVDADDVPFGDPVTISARYAALVIRAGGSLVAGDFLIGYWDLNDGGSVNVGSTNAAFTFQMPGGGMFTIS